MAGLRVMVWGWPISVGDGIFRVLGGELWVWGPLGGEGGLDLSEVFGVGEA